uniref:Uncharacterized protein n=1 Tax=Anguilla anguilla TaxID=7936 RepID=A0A0E9R5C3_ANGAN
MCLNLWMNCRWHCDRGVFFDLVL